jgi:hypothetical protein
MFKNTRKALLALVLSGVVVASSACGIDKSTSAPAAKTGSSILGTSKFVPSSRILYGIPDGTYTITVVPGQAASFDIGGTSRLDIPADGVCDLATSGYGAGTWDAPCSPTAVPVTITVTSQGSNTANPKLDFEPALRFNPAKNVQLYMYGKNVTASDAKNWLIKYCAQNTLGQKACIDESATDSSLTSSVDYTNQVVFRRIKHFSDYELSFDSGYAGGF